MGCRLVGLVPRLVVPEVEQKKVVVVLPLIRTPCLNNRIILHSVPEIPVLP